MKKIALLSLIFLSSLFISPVYSHARAESLYIRTDKSYVKPGSFYNLTVLASRVPFVGYTGLLDVNVTSCTQSDVCNTTAGPWGNRHVQGGSIRIDIAANFAPSRFRAKFKPRGSTWDWSNEIQINVGMTQGLENAQNYWLIPSTPIEYTGTNFADNKDFKTVIGFKAPISLCSESVSTMYFMKNNQSGYWDPHVSWYDSIRGGSGYATQNLLWHLVPWQKKDSWKALGYDDEYLTSIGHERYTYNPTDPFNLSTNFQSSRMTAQDRYQFPNYVLSPKWVGEGWGIGVDSRSSGPRLPSESFCNLPIDATRPTGTWVVHADILDINLPQYQGSALRYKFLEGGQDFATDATKWGLREDWYFIKNMGLVKIEAKYFGPNSSIKSCQQDTDCLMNETMASPHIRLVRSDLLAPSPTPTPLPGDLDSDGHVNIYDYNLLVSKFGNPYTIFDYNDLVGNFGK